LCLLHPFSPFSSLDLLVPFFILPPSGKSLFIQCHDYNSVMTVFSSSIRFSAKPLIVYSLAIKYIYAFPFNASLVLFPPLPKLLTYPNGRNVRSFFLVFQAFVFVFSRKPPRRVPAFPVPPPSTICTARVFTFFSLFFSIETLL